MTEINLQLLSMDELKKLEKSVAKAITTFEERQKSEARSELESLAKKYGYALSDLVETAPQKTRRPAEAKYRHPQDSNLTWSGRGRKPKWISEGLASGKPIEDFLI